MHQGMSRREFLWGTVAGASALSLGETRLLADAPKAPSSPVSIARCQAYDFKVVLDAAGNQLSRLIVRTNSTAILSAIRAIDGKVHLTFEEGIHSTWLYDLL